MRLYIEGPSGAVFDWNDESQNLLAPTNKDERALVFKTLVGALALLSGVTPPASSDAKADDLDQLTQANLQCRDGHKSGAVLRLVTQQDVEA